KAMRSFLKRVNVEVKLGLRNPGLTAAALPQVSFDLFSLEQARGWWAESLDQDFLPELAEAWRAGYWNETTIATGLDAVPQYLARVRDRLVPGFGPMTSPAIPDDAFNMARRVINRALAVGDGPKELSRALAATFSWDQDQPYWERRKADADAEIDRILDAIGPPGSEAREIAKRSDPRVIALRQERNLAQSNIDSVQS